MSFNGTAHIFIIVITFLLPTHAKEAKSSWISYGDWQPVGLAASYYSLEYDADGAGLWFGAHFQGHDSVIHLHGPDLGTLERVLPRFDAQIISGYDRDLGDRVTPIISRSSALRLDDGSVVVQASIGPSYRGGASELYPVLFYSTNGVDDWRYLGPPSGEPAAWLADQRRSGNRIRCEGGGMVQLDDGRLRMYQQNMGATLAVMEAPNMTGPWKFVRNNDGTIVNAVAGLGGDWLFPQVSAIGEHGYILTAGDTWPPRAIRAVISSDGLRFTKVGEDDQQHLVLRPQQVLPGANSLKTLRFAWDEQQQRLLCAANPFQQGKYPLFWTWAQLDRSIFAR